MVSPGKQKMQPCRISLAGQAGGLHERAKKEQKTEGDVHHVRSVSAVIFPGQVARFSSPVMAGRSTTGSVEGKSRALWAGSIHAGATRGCLSVKRIGLDCRFLGRHIHSRD
jgi:hypothetical protein